MGFFDDLMATIQREQNTQDPLFGNLVPRRTQPEFSQQVSQPRMVQSQTLNRGSGPSKPGGDRLIPPVDLSGDIHGGRLKQYNPLADKNLVYDWTEQKINLAKDQNQIDRDRLSFVKEKDIRDFGLDSRKQTFAENKGYAELDLNRDKAEIDHRKQALDEWKARNPEGEIKADEKGRLFIIDKRTGNSIDTGLTGDHFNDKEKLALQQKHALDLEAIKQKNRVTIKGMENNEKLISPTQQRAAEKDAANELLNDPRYAWLGKEGVVEVLSDGSLKLNDPTKGFYGKSKEEAQGTLEYFKRDLKTKAEERMGRTVGGNNSTSTPTSSGKTVSMIDTRGNTIDVPEEDVDEAKSLGAKLPTESNPFANGPVNMDVAQALEIIRDSGGRVVYAGNVKGKR